MYIESTFELELLGALNGLMFENEQTYANGIAVLDVVEYFRKNYQLPEIQAALDVLVNKNILRKAKPIEGQEAYKSTNDGINILEMFIEPYWMFRPYWKVRYPHVIKNLIPQFKNEDDWYIFKKLAAKLSYQNDFTLDKDFAEELADEGKQKPFFGSFEKRHQRSQTNVIRFGHRNPPGKSSIDTMRFFGWQKMVALEDFNAIRIAVEHYQILTDSYADLKITSHMRTQDELYAIFKNHIPEGKKIADAETLFESLARVGLLDISMNDHLEPRTASFYVNYDVRSTPAKEWEYQFISEELNPHKEWRWEINSGGKVDIDRRSRKVRITQKKQVDPFSMGSTLTESAIYSGGASEMQQPGNPVSPESREVFIVHGHDEELKRKVEWYLKYLKLHPIILHKKANSGKTIIEKIEKHSDVPFAVVLMTPDDIYLERGRKIKRARQNVIFELGFFIGKLKRENVCVLYKNVEIPSDFKGVVYIHVDKKGDWRKQLKQELIERGLI